MARKAMTDAEFLASVSTPEAIKQAQRQLGIDLEINMDSENFEFILPDCPNTRLNEDHQGGYCSRCDRYHWKWQLVLPPNYKINGGSWKSSDRYYNRPVYIPVVQQLEVIENGRIKLVAQVTWEQKKDGDGNPVYVQADRYRDAIADRRASSDRVKVKFGHTIKDQGCLSFGDLPQYDSPMSGDIGGREFADLSADNSVWADLLAGADED